MTSEKPNRIAGRLQKIVGRRFDWCRSLVYDTREFAECLSKTFNVPIETVYVGIARQAIHAERLDAVPSSS